MGGNVVLELWQSDRIADGSKAGAMPVQRVYTISKRTLFSRHPIPSGGVIAYTGELQVFHRTAASASSRLIKV